MGKLNREKGKRGEREVVALLKAFGFEARRGQQFKGTKDSPDIIHNVDGIFIEVKLRQSFNLHATIDQAKQEADEGETPLIFHRKDGEPWLATMYAVDFLQLLEELYDD